ncbi:MAG: cobyric acid synthase [Candidatus Methanomethylophilaceae archaeon]|nr:adenosylcobyric acid synthase [Candidatus Methanomethylophilaceae archaeon]
MRVLFLGTSSGAGKTTVSAMYCRYLARKGVRVAPFKASNLSLNSYATSDGGEIGIGQAFQAMASGAVPATDMNPILLKPSGNGRIQVVLNGMPYADITDDTPLDIGIATAEACKAYDRLRERFDAVVCEGSGSPAEINLRGRDIANVGMMRERNIPSVLVGDIERGGVFAALYGTWKLIPEGQRGLLKGFIINRFRGDPTMLESGMASIEEITGMKCLGILPYADLRFPEEDSLSNSGGRMSGKDASSAYLENLDSLIAEAERCGFDFEALKRIAEG